MRGEVEVEPVRAGRRNGEDPSDVPRVPRIDDDDLGRIGDVHIEDLGVRIVDRPAGPAGHADLGQHRLGIEIDHGYRLRSGYLRIADIRDENQPPAMIVGEPVWMDADSDLQHLRVGAGGKNSDRVLRPVRRNDELCFFADQDPGDTRQARNRKQMLSGGRVEDIDRVVRRVGDVDVAARRVDRGVVECSLSFVLRQGDMSDEQQGVVGHDVGPGLVFNRKAMAMMAPAVISPAAVTTARPTRPASMA